MLQLEFGGVLTEGLSVCGQFERRRFCELHDAVRRYVVFQASLFANSQVCCVAHLHVFVCERGRSKCCCLGVRLSTCVDLCWTSFSISD